MRVTTPKILRNLGLLLCFVLSINVPIISSQSLSLPETSLIVPEGSFANVTICHDPHTADTTFEVSTNTSNTGNPAMSGVDYLPISQEVTIPAGVECISQFISIYPDSVDESPENFLLRVETLQQMVFITIADGPFVETADEEEPVVTCINNVIKEISAGSDGAVVEFTEPTATDNSDSVAILSASHRPGQYFTTGVTPVTYIFIDPSGNQGSCTIQVIVFEDRDDCQSTPCLNGGQCSNIGITFQCDCAPGYEGNRCEMNIDECASKPCMNGAQCTDMIDGFQCVCTSGFQGELCQTVTNPCDTLPCQNGATCAPGLGLTYTCTCPDGFEGTNCEIASTNIGPVISSCPSVEDITVTSTGLSQRQLQFPSPTCTDTEDGVGTVRCTPLSGTTVSDEIISIGCTCFDTGGKQDSCFVFLSASIGPCPQQQMLSFGGQLVFTPPPCNDITGNFVEDSTCNPSSESFLQSSTAVTCQCRLQPSSQCSFNVIVSQARIDSCPQMLVVPSGRPLEFTPPSCYDDSGTMYQSTCTPQRGTIITEEITTVTCYCSMQQSLQCMFDVTVGQVLMLGNRVKRSADNVNATLQTDDVSTTAMTVTSTTTVAPELNTTPLSSTVLATTELNTTPLPSTITATAELETTSLPIILTTIQELDTTPFIPSTVPVTPDLDTTLLPSTVPTTPVISNCEENPGICGENATCENITDGIQCNCNEGFSPSGPFAPTNSTICVDTDECEDGTHECVNEASCENTIGSYNCTCPRGFYENGLTENGRQDCKACNRSDGVEQKYGFNCSQPCTCVTGAACAKDTGSCSGPICMNLPTCNKNDLNVTVTTSPTNGEVPEGTIFVVTCSVNLPSTDVNVSWTGPNGEIMDNGGKYIISTTQMSPHVESLQVNEANATDTGMYNCIATLNVPTDSVQFRTESADITVLDLPEIANLRAFPITSTSITLNWTIEDAGGDTLTCRANYTAEETLVTEVQDCSGNKTCWLTNLSPYTPYNITVECRNTAGYSNALNTSERTDTSGPSAPQMPTVVDNSESCIVRWKDSEQSNGPDLHYEVNQFIKDAAKGGLDESSGPVEIKTGTKYEQQKANMRLNSIYTFEICAKNRDHKGDCVNASGSCTTNPGAPASIPTVALPEEDTAVNSTSVTLRVPQVDNRNGPISCYEFVVVKRKNGKPVYASPDEVEFEKIQNETGENGLPYRSVVMNHDDYVSKETVTIGSEANTKTTCMLVASRRRRRANTVEGGKQLTAINSPLESDTSYDIFMRSYSETSGGMFQYASSEFVNVSTAPGDGSSAGLIVSLIILILLIIVVSIVLFIFWQKRNSPDKTHSVVLPMVTTTNGGGADHFDGKNKGFEDDEVISEVPPINIDQLGESILEKHKQSDKLFFAEFRSLMSTNPEATIEAFNNVANKDKNRYINIPCYDHSRVKLNKIGGDENSDYINANYVDGYSVPEKFIAAQGPKEETVEDFWRMIWEQKTKTIIMLTRCFESGRDKCFQYWPDSGQVTHGKFTICLDNTLECPDYVIRQFRLSMNKESDEDDDGESETRMVMQFHFLAWPDHGVPEYPYAMLAFIKRIRQMTQNKPEKGQIVIHCSAGVGRTGTYITIDAMLDRLNEEKTVDIFNFIQKIRLQRSTLVQSQVQYVFIYHALHEEHLYGHTEVRLNDLKQYFRRLKLKTLQDDNSPLHIEFKTAATLPVKDTSTKEASKLGNKEKNRIRNYLPYDKNRVNLERLVGDEDSTYINASYINGYERRNMYIITQAPMENTASDFWRMVWDSLTSTVVMLTDLEEKGNEMCVKFWPEEEPKTFGNLTIELTEQEEEESFTIKDFTMSNNQGVSGRKVRMYQFHGWPEIGVPDCDSVTHLVTLSHEYQRVAEEEESVDQSKHPIIVFCHTGVGRTAIWCALSILLERAKAEGVVDVFQTVRTLRQQRQHMVQDTTQYEFLYQAVLSHLGKLDDLYENLQS